MSARLVGKICGRGGSVGIAVALTLGFTSLPAGAFEKRWHAGWGLGFASFADPETTLGPALGAYAAYGLSDLFDLRTELFTSRHERGQGAFRLLALSAGITYKIDISNWIPSVGLEVGYYRFLGDVRPAESSQRELGFSADFGLDYLVSSGFALGAMVRFHGDPTSIVFESELPFVGLEGTKLMTGLVRAEAYW